MFFAKRITQDIKTNHLVWHNDLQPCYYHNPVTDSQCYTNKISGKTTEF